MITAPTSPRRSPAGHWLLGHFRKFRNDPLTYLSACARDHGDAVPLRFVNRRILLLSDPALIGEVLLGKHRHFRKHIALRRIARPALGDGLLLSEGEAWQRQRQRAQPAFRAERIAAYAQVMSEHTQAMLSTWQDGQSLDLHAQMMALTSRIVTRCLFGSELADQADAVHEAMESLTGSFKARMDSAVRLPLFFPTPANRRFVRGMTRINGVLGRIISQRRQQAAPPGPANDLLGALLAITGDDGRPALDDRQLRDEVATLFVAGHETTANALTWTLWLLAKNPDVRQRLEQEVDIILAGRQPAVEDVPRLSFCRHVLDESMRVMPPVWIIGREAIDAVTIGEHDLAKGTTVLMSQWVVHRDPRWFPDPESFLPQRWANGLAERLPPFAYFPFGGGPRICIGAAFARMEMVLLLASMISRFRMNLASGANIEPLASLTLRPRTGMPMVVEKRSV
jgi:cytochrome P450